MAPDKKGKKLKKAQADEAQQQPPAVDAVPAEKGILQELPHPVTIIDISDPEMLAGIYEKSIDDIIQSMRNNSGIEFNFKEANGKNQCIVPVTPGLDNSPSGAYVIELTDGKKRLQLVAEKHQNWFRGIVTDNGGRYEIDDINKHKMMSGSESFHTTSVYYDLLRETVDRCKVGYSPLVDAFYTLVGHNARSKKDYKTAIAVILVMLFEAPRFAEVFEMNLELLKAKKEGYVGETFKDMINDWADTCEDFFEENGDQMAITLSNDTEGSVKKVAKSVRLLCRTRWDAWLEKKNQNAPKPPKWTPPKKLREHASSSRK